MKDAKDDISTSIIIICGKAQYGNFEIQSNMIFKIKYFEYSFDCPLSNSNRYKHMFHPGYADIRTFIEFGI